MVTEQVSSHASTQFDHVVLVIGGAPPNALAIRQMTPFQRVVCADSGVDHARALGLTPDLVVGDMDSISDDARSWATARGASFEVAAREKDRTDTELALARIASTNPRMVTVLWGGGDRIDHVLGVIAAAAAPELSRIEHLRLWVGDDLVEVLHGPRSAEFALTLGVTSSLVPLAGPVTGVTTTGLRWDLRDETLVAHRARGVSNVVTGPVRIDVRSGVLAVVVPGAVHGEPTTTIPPFNEMENS